jgi:hypothetical protein
MHATGDDPLGAAHQPARMPQQPAQGAEVMPGSAAGCAHRGAYRGVLTDRGQAEQRGAGHGQGDRPDMADGDRKCYDGEPPWSGVGR